MDHNFPKTRLKRDDKIYGKVFPVNCFWAFNQNSFASPKQAKQEAFTESENAGTPLIVTFVYDLTLQQCQKHLASDWSFSGYRVWHRSKIGFSSQSVDCGSYKLYLCVCVFVCLSVCPAFTAFNLLTICWSLIKLGENVGTLFRLIVLKFHKSRFSVYVIMTSFLSLSYMYF